ncbi:MAG TPA: hypothetical protein VLM37_09495 [Fibrobacteraceae bacterium]|nr:hypothetical protein [Fibrobacteraceae bacterium]
MKSIRWIKQVLVDGQLASLEIMIGVQNIADRCYVRVNQEPEFWFTAKSSSRLEVVRQGLDLLHSQLANHQVTHTDGQPFDWETT